MAKTDHSKRPDPWGQNRTFADLLAHELQYIVDTDGHSEDDVKAAKAMLKPTPPPPPAPAAAPPAPPSAGFTAGFAAAPAPAAPTTFAAPAPPNNAPSTQFTAPAAAFPAPGGPGFPAAPQAQNLAPASAPAASFPAGFPAAPAAPAPAAAPAVNPKRVAVDTAMQNLKTTIFANHQDVRRFLGAWTVSSTNEATDEQLDQMTGVLAANPADIASWLSQFPVPA